MPNVDLSQIVALIPKIDAMIQERTKNHAKIDFVATPQEIRDRIDAGKTDESTLYVVTYTKDELC